MPAKRKKILIHSLVFSPDSVSTAYLYNDIALGFQRSGYEVIVLTTTPHYNLVGEALSKQQLTRRFLGLFYVSSFQGIKVFHVPQKKFRSFLARIAGFIFWHLISFLIGVVQRNISVILSPSPPLTIGIVSILIGKLKGAKVIYNVQEIYPDLLINQGKLKSNFVTGILRRMERFVYNQSDAVTTIDEVFYNTIVGRVREPGKLTLIPNFVDTDIYYPIDSSSSKLDHLIFPDTPELKLMYAGNIGYAQDWQPLVHIANVLREEPVSFWVIGEGILKDQLKLDIQLNKLDNIHLLPYMPRDTMASLIAYADLQFIFMEPKLDGQGFPSKVYTIMACGKPMLVISGENTPMVNFLQDKQCAVLITETDTKLRLDQLEFTIRRFIANRPELKKLGENGLSVIKGTYAKEAVVMQYISLVDKLLNSNYNA